MSKVYAGTASAFKIGQLVKTAELNNLSEKGIIGFYNGIIIAHDDKGMPVAFRTERYMDCARIAA